MAGQITKAPVTKRKRWVEVVAPKIFNHFVFGESLVSEPEALVGRAITVNLSNITGEIKQQNINVRFRVTDVKEGAAVTELEGFTTSPSLIKRLVRRETKRIDEVIRCEAADKKKVELKFFIVTKAFARSTAITALRAELKKTVADIAKKSGFDELFRLLITNRFQMQIKNSLKRIYPVKSCEVKSFGIVPGSAPESILPKKIKEAKQKKEAKEEHKEAEETPKEKKVKGEPKEAKAVKEGEGAKEEKKKEAKKGERQDAQKK